MLTNRLAGAVRAPAGRRAIPFREQVEGRFASCSLPRSSRNELYARANAVAHVDEESVASDMGIAAEILEYTPFVEHAES